MCIETVATSGQTVTARVEVPSPVPTAATDGHVTIYVASVMSMEENTRATLSLPTPKTALHTIPASVSVMALGRVLQRRESGHVRTDAVSAKWTGIDTGATRSSGTVKDAGSGTSANAAVMVPGCVPKSMQDGPVPSSVETAC